MNKTFLAIVVVIILLANSVSAGTPSPTATPIATPVKPETTSVVLNEPNKTWQEFYCSQFFPSGHQYELDWLLTMKCNVWGEVRNLKFDGGKNRLLIYNESERGFTHTILRDEYCTKRGTSVEGWNICVEGYENGFTLVIKGEVLQ